MVLKCRRAGIGGSVYGPGGCEIGALVCDRVDNEEGDLDFSEFV